MHDMRGVLFCMLGEKFDQESYVVGCMVLGGPYVHSTLCMHAVLTSVLK